MFDLLNNPLNTQTIRVESPKRISTVALPELKRKLIPPILQVIHFLDCNVKNIEGSNNKYALSAETVDSKLTVASAPTTEESTLELIVVKNPIQLHVTSTFEKELQRRTPKVAEKLKRMKDLALKRHEKSKIGGETKSVVAIEVSVAFKGITENRRSKDSNRNQAPRYRKIKNEPVERRLKLQKNMKPSFKMYSPFQSGFDIDLKGLGNSLNFISPPESADFSFFNKKINFL
jgi:hypothetical protein